VSVVAFVAAIVLAVGPAGADASRVGDFAGFTLSVASPQTAGNHFTVTITAYDADHDGDANYSGSKCVTFSGPAPSPNGTAPSYPGNGSCPSGQSNLTFNSSFKATATITLYDAQSPIRLTVMDGPTSKSGTSGNFTVNPGSAYRFNVPTPGTQTAGAPFPETLTALDMWGNTATGFAGSQSVTFGGPSNSPNGTQPSSPSSVGFTAGVGTASITLFDAQTTTLSATQGSITGTTPQSFSVNPGSLLPSFSAQPTDAQISMPIYSNVVTQAPVTVSVADAFGNLAPDGTAVGMSSAPAGLAGAAPSPTTSGGVATFGNLSLAAIGTYRLIASVGSLTATSNSFDVVQQLAVCSGAGSCQVSATDSAQSANTSVNSGTGTSFQGLILTTTFVPSPPPSGLCGGFTPLTGTTGTSVEATGGNVSASQPNFTITFTIPKATLQAAGLNYLQALTLNVCLGAERFDGSTDPGQAWTGKFGVPATYDSGTGLYWGLVGDWPFWWLPNPNPHITARYIDLRSGALVIVLVKPYPWDGRAYV
jgi:hypothetical protein